MLANFIHLQTVLIHIRSPVVSQCESFELKTLYQFLSMVVAALWWGPVLGAGNTNNRQGNLRFLSFWNHKLNSWNFLTILFSRLWQWSQTHKICFWKWSRQTLRFWNGLNAIYGLYSKFIQRRLNCLVEQFMIHLKLNVYHKTRSTLFQKVLDQGTICLRTFN